VSRIFKYSLDLVEKQKIEMPTNAKILSVQDQRGTICIWAEVGDYTETGRTFRIVGTGHQIPDESLNFIATVQQGDFVWHIYEQAPA
jgi:hypothetical protein